MSTEDSATEARARGNVYGLLALAFYPPTRDAGHVQEDMLRVLRTLRGSVAKYSAASEDLSLLEREYNRLFVGPAHVACPPYESVYPTGGGKASGSVLGPPSVQVASEYAAAGLKFADGFTDLPDHVSVELEYLKYLCDKEAGASAESRDEWRFREAKFLREHMCNWMPGFADSVTANTTSPFYSLAAELLRVFLGIEADGLPRS